MIRRLHFVYNVELTPTALVRDFLHRLTDPATYPCRLCDLTYGRFVKKPSWQLFVRSLPVKSGFHTKDRFRKAHPGLSGFEFPVVLAEHHDGSMQPFLSKDDLSKMRSLEDLESAIRSRLSEDEARTSR